MGYGATTPTVTLSQEDKVIQESQNNLLEVIKEQLVEKKIIN